MLEPAQIGPARRRKGLTQTELAKRSGVSQSLIAKIEAGRLDPSFSRLKALSDALTNHDVPRTAQDVMKRDVVLMYATESVAQAIEHMQRHSISQLPVFDEGVLVGTVTEEELLAFVAKPEGESKAAQMPVRSLMAAAMPQIAPTTPADSLPALLELFPAVLVAANGRLQGIITRSDLLRRAHNNGSQ